MSISIIVAIVKLDNGGLDPIYTLLIANVLIGIATFIVLWSYISTIIQTFTQDSLASNEKVDECMYKVWHSF